MKRPSIAIVDDSALANELFAQVVGERIEADVVPLPTVGDFEGLLHDGERFDLALVDLSFPEEGTNGLAALYEAEQLSPCTMLAIITQGDSFVGDLLKECWLAFDVRTVISKSAPIDFQLRQIERVLATGRAPVDPSVETLLPAGEAGARGTAPYGELVTHAGHAKLWMALLNADDGVTYQQVVEATGLRLNTVKNYRSQLIDPMRRLGLDEPSLREMQAFAQRLEPIIRQVCAHATGRR